MSEARVLEAPKFIEPTPETVAKLKPCSLHFLDSELQRAGYLIADAFAVITCGLHIKIASGSLTVIGKTVMPITLTDQLAEKLIAYRKWIDAMKQYRLEINPVLDVCFENMSCRDIARKYKHHTGWAGTLVREALELYIKVNG